MITLKTNPYSESEKVMLAYLFTQLEEMCGKLCEPGGTCKTCKFRHVCYDVTSAKEHAVKLANQETPKK